MKEVIIILGLIIGVILLIVGNKIQTYKYLRIIGIIIILVCLVIEIPSFIKGLIDGLQGK